MSKKKHQDNDKGIESIENALSRTEQYIEENQKSLTIIVVAIAVVVAGYLGYKRFYLAPMEKKAQEWSFVAEKYFEKDSFNLALYGDGSALGFIDIIDEFGMTKTATLANYYAGISFLHMGEYEEAIDYLKKFDANDKLISSIALGAIGDANSQLGNYNEAVDYYMNAADNYVNDFSSPIYLKKAGALYEKLGEYSKALAVYERIEKEFSKSEEAMDIERDIAAVKLKI